ncbi:hypothetical protein PPL_09032 [Heterostelium album PN500]|uniref:Uncharacterized protein n=1 Tax=Heterostelium pallidum (strain ATCC 26659 / Pp 5 / PN500) TaxID=670386 RepID=D3BKF1_HETP5|nr:hypothetical protein PPL_09032 [Heterostelium album PN500]EFA78381.1 hypothetical protein PPL_09032 [Heterostelium album PN500]|eukprot:XP_020430506.1 hypothetical protein PPL_09032 [Heterostelium album PN500]
MNRFLTLVVGNRSSTLYLNRSSISYSSILGCRYYNSNNSGKKYDEVDLSNISKSTHRRDFKSKLISPQQSSTITQLPPTPPKRIVSDHDKENEIIVNRLKNFIKNEQDTIKIITLVATRPQHLCAASGQLALDSIIAFHGESTVPKSMSRRQTRYIPLCFAGSGGEGSTAHRDDHTLSHTDVPALWRVSSSTHDIPSTTSKPRKNTEYEYRQSVLQVPFEAATGSAPTAAKSAKSNSATASVHVVLV